MKYDTKDLKLSNRTANQTGGEMPAASTLTGQHDIVWEDGVLVITRLFDAPRHIVFKAWTEPEHFARWFSPKDSTMPFCKMDVRAGGVLHFCHLHGHEKVWVKGTYHEVADPERIGFTCFFSDEAGNRIERPGFPTEMRIEVAFAEEAGKTIITIWHHGLVLDQGEVQGWAESLDRLEGYLKPSVGF
jgi:uncharacterized protein YndB with AHSA1/START domain